MRALITMVLLGACAGSGAPPLPTPDTGDGAALDPGDVRLYMEAQQSGWDQPRTQVIADEGALRLAWTTMFRNVTPAPPIPAIDFDAYRLVLVAAGMRPTGGFALEFSSGRVTADSMILDVVVRAPRAGCGVTQALTSPAVMLRIPRQPAAVAVMTRERSDTTACT